MGAVNLWQSCQLAWCVFGLWEELLGKLHTVHTEPTHKLSWKRKGKKNLRLELNPQPFCCDCWAQVSRVSWSLFQLSWGEGRVNKSPFYHRAIKTNTKTTTVWTHLHTYSEFTVFNLPHMPVFRAVTGTHEAIKLCANYCSTVSSSNQIIIIIHFVPQMESNTRSSSVLFNSFDDGSAF